MTRTNIKENLSNFLKRRIPFDTLKDELNNILDYSVNAYMYSNSGDFVADVCDNLVDNMIEEFDIKPKDKDDLYFYFVDTFGKYITKKYQHSKKSTTSEQIDKMNLQEQISRIKMIINESKGWGNSKQKLQKKFTFKDFNEAINFVNNVAKIAKKQNHHPDMEINYNKVTISITDHEKGGVSDKCHKFVDEVNKL